MMWPRRTLPRLYTDVGRSPMMRDRYEAAFLFLPRCVWHRFRELDGFLVSRCRDRDLRPRIDLDTPRWRSTARCTFSMRPCSSRWASACRTLWA